MKKANTGSFFAFFTTLDLIWPKFYCPNDYAHFNFFR